MRLKKRKPLTGRVRPTLMSLRSFGSVLFATFLSLSLIFPLAAQQQRTLKHYALILEDPAVSDRFPSRDAVHSIAAENYRGQIRARQSLLKNELDSRKFVYVGAVDTLSNAMFVVATPDRLDELKGLPGVKGVIPMRAVKPRLNQAVALANASTMWTALGGQSKAGAGMMIAVIGSGIDQTHPAFQDSTLTAPSGFPKCTTGHPEDCNYTNSKVIVARSYVRQLAAGSSTDATKVAADSGPDDYSPRDRSGHATAIASVIAGNQNTGPAVSFTGVAPKAWLGNYKVENSPGMPGGGNQGVTGGSFEDIYVLALEDAYNDGMHIANLSSGVIATTGAMDTGTVCGLASGVPCDYMAYYYEKAAQMGMVITVSVGNDGENGEQYPTFSLTSSPANAPSIIAVGATMNNHVLQPSVTVVGGPSNLQNVSAQTSDAYSGYIGAAKYAILDAAQVGNDGYACSPLAAYALYNAVALIQQGGASGCTYTTKATNAANAGAIGVIFYQNTSGAAQPVEVQDASGNIPLYGPIVVLSQSDGQALKTYIDAHAGSSVVVDAAGWEMDLATYNAQALSLFSPGFSPALAKNQLLGYSSPGPTPGDLLIKPDIISTGGIDQSNGPAWQATNAAVQDYNFFAANAMYMATQNYDQSSDMYSSTRYIAASGTSFSAPMVAGAAALLWQLHPSYTAAQIKALLMNTAATDTPGDNWGYTVDALNIGAGRLDLGAASSATVIAQAVTADGTNPVSVSFGAVTKLPVSKQIKITNLGSGSVTLTVAVTAPLDVNGGKATGVTTALDKTNVTLAGGASSTVTLTLSGTVPSADEYTGSINVTGSGVSIHLPYLLLVASGVAWDVQAIQYSQSIPSYYGGCFESLANGDAGTIGIKLVDSTGIPVANSPVSFSVSPRNSATIRSVTGEPACSPSSTTSATTCNTDTYGIAWIDVVGGASISLNPLITAKAAGNSVYFGGTGCGVIINAPTVSGITTNFNGANVAPGSYISIKGSNLVDSLSLINSSGDLAPFLPLPMNLDAVSVSFDIPGSYDGKPADYNGFPGYIYAITSSQINLMVPYELQGATSALVKITVDGFVDSNVITIPLVTYAPEVWHDFTTGIVSAYDIDPSTGAGRGQIWSSAISGFYGPAAAGDIVELYGNGLGPVNNQPASGAAWTDASNVATTKSACTVTVGGKSAQVLYCGLAYGSPGQYQINITVPSGLSSGNQPVILTVGGVSSPSASLPVK